MQLPVYTCHQKQTRNPHALPPFPAPILWAVKPILSPQQPFVPSGVRFAPVLRYASHRLVPRRPPGTAAAERLICNQPIKKFLNNFIKQSIYLIISLWFFVKFKLYKNEGI